MKNDQWDVVKIPDVYGKPRIGIITRIIEIYNKKSYYVVICGEPRLYEVHIEYFEIEENITKKQSI
jgi:hypothetical protein